MNDLELLEQFVRVDRTESRVRILVCEIHWRGPHTSVPNWVIYRELAGTATEAEVGHATSRLLTDRRYFGVCGKCDERKPVGWMHERRMCQSCAEEYLGVVH